MFYEMEHSNATDMLWNSGVREDYRFPPHLHGSFECITVTAGEMTLHVGKNVYTLGAGESALIFPEQVHSMETPVRSSHFLVIFSVDYVKAFLPFCRDHTPTDNRFVMPRELSDALRLLSAKDSALHIKSVLYSLCDIFDRGAAYVTTSHEKEMLLLRIINFVADNFRGDCTLIGLSRTLGYNQVYLSRYFSERTGMTFSEYVSRFRVGECCYRLSNSGDSVTQIAPECGFESMRSFHRNFRAVTGMTPGQYRKANGHP